MTSVRPVLARKLLSMFSAAALAFCVFALLPVSQSDIFSAKRPEKEYALVRLAPRKKPPEDSAGRAVSAGTGFEMPGASAPSGESGAGLPELGIPSGYGVADVSAGAGGDVFGMKSFALSDGAVGGGDFEIKAFELARLDRVPKRLRSGSSEYPRHLYSRGLEGSVLLSLFINADGTVEVECVISSTHADFEPAAIKAAKSQLYEPPLMGGKPVRARFELQIPFKIIK